MNKLEEYFLLMYHLTLSLDDIDNMSDSYRTFMVGRLKQKLNK